METGKKRRGSIKERPIFGPRQVLTKDEIVPGKKFRRHRIGGDFIVKILGNPVEEKPRQWWVRYQAQNTALEDNGSLSDWGVTPYENGSWNPNNWLERLE